VLAKLQMAGDSAGCVGRDIAETGRCPLRVPFSDSGRDFRHSSEARGSDATAGADTDRVLGHDFRPQVGVAPPRLLTRRGAQCGEGWRRLTGEMGRFQINERVKARPTVGPSRRPPC
jgi:hypothetical protein